VKRDIKCAQFYVQNRTVNTRFACLFKLNISMSKKLFIGNLDWNTSEDELKTTFAKFGDVEEAIIIKDYAGRSKGFGFVTFTDDAAADKATAELNGAELGSRKINVSEARPPKERD
jgi:RNA recognition motif-containing protein